MKLKKINLLIIACGFYGNVAAMNDVPDIVNRLSFEQRDGVINALHDSYCSLAILCPCNMAFERDMQQVLPGIQDEDIRVLKRWFEKQAFYNFFRDVLRNAHDLGGFNLVNEMIKVAQKDEEVYLGINNNVLNTPEIRGLYERTDPQETAGDRNDYGRYLNIKAIDSGWKKKLYSRRNASQG